MNPADDRRLLCVYCSSSNHVAGCYMEAAARLGRGMVERGWGLVYGGSRVGLMGVLARAVHEAGGHVVGVIPHFMKSREFVYEVADELVTVDSMHDRKRIMAERAGAFVTLPGGIGTLEEFGEILALRYLRRLNKPVILVNQNGYYDDLLAFLRRMTRERFKPQGIHELFSVTPTVDGIWDLLGEGGLPDHGGGGAGAQRARS